MKGFLPTLSSFPTPIRITFADRIFFKVVYVSDNFIKMYTGIEESGKYFHKMLPLSNIRNGFRFLLYFLKYCPSFTHELIPLFKEGVR